MKKVFILLSSLMILAASMVSCRKDELDLPNPDGVKVNSYVELFDVVWHGIDQCYLFWDRDTTDWDAAYRRYRPLFEEFDLKGGASDWEFYRVIENWMGGLVDHHFMAQIRNLSTGNPAYVSPGSREVTSRPYYHYTDRAQQLACLQIIPGVTSYKAWDGECGNWFCVIPAEGNDKIAYFRFEGFQFSSLRSQVQYGGNAYTHALDPLKAFYGSVLDGMSTSGWANNSYVKALIIDVRGNGGGNMSELKPLIGSLCQQDLLLGYGRTKEGLGRLDYSAFTPFHIQCPEKHLLQEKPIVVLADCNSVSCAEIMTLSIKSLPNGTFIGDRTWGGTGPLMPGQNNVLYSGVFGNYGRYGYYVYTSNFDLVDRNFQSLEGKGIEPDIWVDYDQEALDYGQDRQLNAAIDYLKTQIK